MKKDFWETIIADVQEFGVSKKDRDILLNAFEYVMKKTPSLTKKAVFDVDEFQNASKYVKGYTLKIERLRREKDLEQWQAEFIKNEKVIMTSIGQIES